MKMKKMKVILNEVLDDHGDIPVRVETEVVVEEMPTSLEIKPKGYGDFASADGSGVPIILEVCGGILRLVVWADINDDNPTHIINLEGARETARKGTSE